MNRKYNWNKFNKWYNNLSENLFTKKTISAAAWASSEYETKKELKAIQLGIFAISFSLGFIVCWIVK
jgi:hypothetical protein